MNGVTIDTAELDRIMGKLTLNRNQIGKRMAFEIEAQAKINAPYKTTALLNSIYTVTQDSDGFGGASSAAQSANPGVITEAHPAPMGNVVANVGPCVDYAEYQEFGTSKMAAHPYLIPAVETVAGKYESGEAWAEIING